MSAVKKLSQIETRRIEWLVKGMIPKRRIIVIAGAPEQGKSTMTAWLAAHVTNAGHSVIYSNFEDDVEQTSRPRLVVAGAIEKRVFIPEEPYMIPRDLDQLERKVKQIRASLIICDSANQHLIPKAGNGQAIRQALTPLKAMLERTGATIVFVDHLLWKKATRVANPLAAFAGSSSGLPAHVRLAYVFGRNPRDPEERVLAAAKANELREKPSFLFEMEDAATFTRDGDQVEVGRLRLVNADCDVTDEDVVSYVHRSPKKDEGLRGAIAKEWLIGALMFGPKLATVVMQEGDDAGFSWRTLQRQAEQVGVKRNRVDPATMKPKAGKGSAVLWRLPDDHPALMMGALMAGVQAQPTSVVTP